LAQTVPSHLSLDPTFQTQDAPVMKCSRIPTPERRPNMKPTESHTGIIGILRHVPRVYCLHTNIGHNFRLRKTPSLTVVT
jgi:hypothetical protein